MNTFNKELSMMHGIINSVGPKTKLATIFVVLLIVNFVMIWMVNSMNPLYDNYPEVVHSMVSI